MDGIELHGVTAGYSGNDVLRGIDLTVTPGECLAVLGPNGAGKSTLLRVLSGQIRPSAGRCTIDGKDMTGQRPFRFARAGARWVGDPRPIYPDLSIEDNLSIGGLIKRDRIATLRENVYELLPDLARRRQQAAGSLSGGQQQMLAIGQALMSEPRYIFLDEPSLGLAAQLVQAVAEKIVGLARMGVGVVWAEQFPEVALRHADRAVILGAGQILGAGAASSITPAMLDAAYMGHPVERRAGGERPSGAGSPAR